MTCISFVTMTLELLARSLQQHLDSTSADVRTFATSLMYMYVLAGGRVVRFIVHSGALKFVLREKVI